MAGRTLPNLGLIGFFDFGENGWDDEMSENLLKLSVLTQGTVIDVVSATPGSPSNGDVYIFDETHPTEANAVAIYDDGAWFYVAPVEGWLAYDRDGNRFVYFDGASWSTLNTGGGGGGPSPVTTVSAADSDLLNTQNGNYIRFTNAGAKTYTVRPDSTEALDDDGEWHVRNVGVADLTIVEGSGVTVNPPNGGTLVVPQGGTVTLKRVATDEFDLLGQTVAA